MKHALFLLLAGCAPLAAVIDPPLAQLARWQAAPSLAGEQPVIQPCPEGHRACPQLQARRAEACMARAMAARAPAAACPGSAALGDLECAAVAYAAARRVDASPALAAGQAQALICAGHLSANRDHGRRALETAAAAPPDRAPLLQARAQAVIDLPTAQGAPTSRNRNEGARP